jgi:hypothetical protein
VRHGLPHLLRLRSLNNMTPFGVAASPMLGMRIQSCGPPLAKSFACGCAECHLVELDGRYADGALSTVR